jgi:hypothetical protein
MRYHDVSGDLSDLVFRRFAVTTLPDMFNNILEFGAMVRIEPSTFILLSLLIVTPSYYSKKSQV